MFREKIDYLDKNFFPFFMIMFINIYKFVSKLFFRKRIFRFYTSCSEDSKKAIKEKGFLKGFFLTFKRILKCHPFNPGGVDFL